MTWNVKTIVVGVDGSEGAQRAADEAAGVARATGAKLILATVVRPPEGWWGIGGAPPTPEALSAALVEGQQEVLNQVVANLDLDGIDYETVQELGDPANRLIALAEERNVDLMVIGRRGPMRAPISPPLAARKSIMMVTDREARPASRGP